MRILSPHVLAQMRARQESNMPALTDILGPPGTTAGPKGQPVGTDTEIALAVKCRIGAPSPDEVTHIISGQVTARDIIRVTLPYGTPVKKSHRLLITDETGARTANIISVKPRHSNSTAEIVYAQEA